MRVGFVLIGIMTQFLNIAAYLFTPLDDLTRLRRELKATCVANGLRGTILLSHEGINLFIAGEETPLRAFLASLTARPEFADLEVKESWSDHQPFNRMLVRLKSEIISMGIDGLDPRNRPSPKLSAKELKRWLDEGRDVVLFDVRNDYEIEVGTFKGAKAVGVDHFRHFPQAIQTLPDEFKSKPVVMFCTGGIRCEKAGPYMQKGGYENVFQLDGGILKYFEECGGAHYEGDCFVFDKRVALNPELKESGLAMCYVCQSILSLEDQLSPHYVPERSCPHCIDNHDTCSLPTNESREDAIRAVTSPLPGSIPYDNVRPIRIPLSLDGKGLEEAVELIIPGQPHGYWSDEIRLGRIRLGNVHASANAIVKAGQRYAHLFPGMTEPNVSAEIRVIYEDDSIVVVNKPAPLPMHPSGRFNRNTLVWILRSAFKMPWLRPVHRLDANTTGLAIFAKSRAIAGQLQRQFTASAVTKTYLAEVYGYPENDRFSCDAPISKDRTAAGGRSIPQGAEAIGTEDIPVSDAPVSNEISLNAETRFIVRSRLANSRSLVEAYPITGRTNQIRLHLWHLGFPIVGDLMYLPNGKIGMVQTSLPPGIQDEDSEEAVSFERMRLHAWKIEFQHPKTAITMTFSTPLPNWA